MFGSVVRIVAALTFLFVGLQPVLAVDPLEVDYAKPPSWWPVGVRYANPPQKKAPKGWQGKWPPDVERGHDFSFWTEYYKLKPSGPRRFGTPGDPDAPFADGFAGNFRFISRIPNFRQQRFCQPFGFAARSKPTLIGEICGKGMFYPTKDVANLCKGLVDNRQVDRFCANQCAAKFALASDSGKCTGSVVRPPASWRWSCVDKEAAALISCEVQFICDCEG